MNRLKVFDEKLEFTQEQYESLQSFEPSIHDWPSRKTPTGAEIWIKPVREGHAVSECVVVSMPRGRCSWVKERYFSEPS